MTMDAFAEESNHKNGGVSFLEGPFDAELSRRLDAALILEEDGRSKNWKKLFRECRHSLEVEGAAYGA